jgi:hypothetical protein
MRRTPPVVVHLGPQPAVQVCIAFIALLASAGLAGWATSHWAAAWPVWLLLPLAALWAWHAAAVRPRRLRWDGEAWWLAEPNADAELAVQIAVLIDLDTWLLLHAGTAGCWLPLSRRQQAGQWTALRATLFSAPPGVLPP